ncbi:MAG: hypothetical protein ACOYMK_02685 [Hyphomonadaceae bacterium]|jgi:ElaB/YqjD/DUF883 family membrane-anchored ribosome-binding protein
MTGRRTDADYGNSVENLAGMVAGDMSELSERTKRALGGAQEFAGEFAEGAAKSGRKAAKFVVREVREHPLRTLAIGAAVGAVVAAVIMLRNKSDE